MVIFSLLLRAEIHHPRPEISILAQTEVSSGQTIRLIDIATVSFVSPVQAQLALGLSLLPPQADREVKKIKNSEMIKLIRAKIAGIPEIAEEKWTYFIPEEIEIVAKKNILSVQSVQNQLTIAILKRCGDCKVNLHDIKIPQIRENAAFENCEIQTETVKVGGSFLVPVQCHFGKESKTYWISGVSKISKFGPVMNRQLIPGEKISAKDFRIEEVDITYAKDGLPQAGEVEGQLAGRFLQINQPIYKSDYRRELAINRGQLIRAVSGNETFEISSQAVAEEQGYVGDTIKVRNSESQKTLSGQIIEKGVVKVQ